MYIMSTQNFKFDTQSGHKTADERPVSNGVSTIEQTVMKRVRRIHTLRRFLNPTTYKMYGTGVLGAVLFSMVSVPSVLSNMLSLHSPFVALEYFIKSALQTELLVQFILVSMCLACVLVVRDIAKMTKQHRHVYSQLN
jgi:hypothetical protein